MTEATLISDLLPGTSQSTSGLRGDDGCRCRATLADEAVSPLLDRIAAAEDEARGEVRVVERSGGFSVTRLAEHDPIPGPPDERAPCRCGSRRRARTGR